MNAAAAIIILLITIASAPRAACLERCSGNDICAQDENCVCRNGQEGSDRSERPDEKRSPLDAETIVVTWQPNMFTQHMVQHRMIMCDRNTWLPYSFLKLLKREQPCFTNECSYIVSVSDSIFMKFIDHRQQSAGYTYKQYLGADPWESVHCFALKSKLEPREIRGKFLDYLCSKNIGICLSKNSVHGNVYYHKTVVIDGKDYGTLTIQDGNDIFGVVDNFTKKLRSHLHHIGVSLNANVDMNSLEPYKIFLLDDVLSLRTEYHRMKGCRVNDVPPRVAPIPERSEVSLHAQRLLRRVGVAIPFYCTPNISVREYSKFPILLTVLKTIATWARIAEKISVVLITNKGPESVSALKAQLPGGISLHDADTCYEWRGDAPVCLYVRNVPLEEVAAMKRDLGTNDPEWYHLPSITYSVFEDMQMREKWAHPTAYIYLEEDIGISAQALHSWAEDSIVLEPLGYLRSFYMVEEVPKEEGGPYLVLISSLQTGIVCNPLRKHCSEQYSGLAFETIHAENRHFARLSQPYSACFAATHTQIESFRKSQYWRSVHGDIYDVRASVGGIIQYALANSSKLHHAAVVPWRTIHRQDGTTMPHLEHSAAVFHLPNKYYREKKICVGDSLIFANNAVKEQGTVPRNALGTSHMYSITRMHGCKWNAAKPMRAFMGCLPALLKQGNVADSAAEGNKNFDIILKDIQASHKGGQVTIVEINDENAGLCQFSGLARKMFSVETSIVCFGANTVLDIDDNVLYLHGGSHRRMDKSPDVVHVQTCLAKCSYKSSGRNLLLLVRSALETYVDFGEQGTLMYVNSIVQEMAQLARRDFKIAKEFMGNSGLWKFQTLRSAKLVDHSYTRNGFGEFLKFRRNTYEVHIDTEFRPPVYAIRRKDKTTIPFLHLGLSLNLLLKASPHVKTRKKLIRLFAEMDVTEDMAPWNMLYTESKLKFIDADAMHKRISYVNPNLMVSFCFCKDCFNIIKLTINYLTNCVVILLDVLLNMRKSDSATQVSLMLLRGCEWKEADRAADPIQVYKECMSSTVEWIFTS